MTESNITFSVRVKLIKDSKPFFGVGVSRLLFLTKETNSLRSASSKMNMSYSKAFRIVKEAEEALGYKLLERSIGGTNGGYSKLTEQGESFIFRFSSLEKEVEQYTHDLIEKYFNEE